MRSRGWAAAPHEVGQGVGREVAVQVERERGDDGPLLARTEGVLDADVVQPAGLAERLKMHGTHRRRTRSGRGSSATQVRPKG